MIWIKLTLKPENGQVSMVFGQMNEPRGVRLRSTLSA